MAPSCRSCAFVHSIVIALAGCMGAAVWLTLLVATNFNAVALGIGLLAALYITGGRL